MSRENKHTPFSAADIEQYLAGKLSPREMHAMEKAALADPFLAEAIAGYEAMKDREWNDQLVAVHEAIVNKGVVAKVIPLHRSKNNWWKIAAAIFILGAGSTLTFILTNKNSGEKSNRPVAQLISATTDSAAQALPETPAPATASLNPTAPAAKDEIQAIPGSVTQTGAAKQADDKYVAKPGASQVNPGAPNITAGAPGNAQAMVTAPAVNENPSAAPDNAGLAEESHAAKNKAAVKQNMDADAFARQRNQDFANAKKEAVPNHFFTAQVVAPDNSPLPFTNISIKKENFGTYADARGMVRLVSTDSILNIEVRSAGYIPKTFSLRNNQSQTKLVLQEEEPVLKGKPAIGNTAGSANRKSRRACLLTDPVANVEPADGWDNYNTYVANNLDIPDDLLKPDFQGAVELSFDVRPNGTVTNIRITSSQGAAYDEAAKRLITEGPQWKVKKGKKNSANIKVQF